LAVVQSEK
jgi:hypothetical protein